MVTKNNFLILLMGFMIILSVIWNRFLRERLPKDVQDFFVDKSLIYYFFIFMLIIGFIINIIYNIRIIYNIKPNPNSFIRRVFIGIANNDFVDLISSVFNKYIIESPKTFYEIIIFQKFDVSVFEIPTYKFIKFMRNKPMSTIFFICNIIPRSIVVNIFLFDVLYIHHINYFYTSLLLLSIPLIIKSYIYIMENLTKRNMKFFLAHVKVTEVENNLLHYCFEDKTPNIEDAIDITNKNNDPLLKWFYIILINP